MRYSAEERRAHVELWRESGLSRAAYCRQSDLTYATFTQWVQRMNGTGCEQTNGVEGEDAFIELQVGHGQARGRGNDPEVVRAELVGAGVTVLINGCTTPGRMAAILEALARC